MSNQISEQLNKRLDAVNLEIERLRNKNSKLKNKYKQLKQAIYITEEEEQNESKSIQHNESLATHAEAFQQQPIHEEFQHQQPQQQPTTAFIPPRRSNGINFNRFFN